MRKSSFINQHLIVAALCVMGASLGCHNTVLSPPSSTLRLIVTSSPESLDTRFSSTAVADALSKLVYAPLFVVNDNLEPEPFLALSVSEISPTVFDVRLRKGLQFHDGSPLLAQDVAYTFGHLHDPDVRSPRAADYEYLDRVEAVTPLIARFYLKRVHAPFFLDLTGLGIVSHRKTNTGSGPFCIKSNNSATETIILEAFDRWFEGKPPLKEIEIRTVRDATTRLLELIRGKADMSPFDTSPLLLDVLRRYPKTLEILLSPGVGYTYLAFNMRGPPTNSTGPESENDRTLRALSNPLVRQAIAQSIDLDTVVKTKFRGAAQRASGMIPNGHWAKSASLRPLPYDLKAAAALLDQAGFRDRGPAHHGRFQLTIKASPDRFRQSLSLIYTDSLRKMEIEAGLRVQDWGSLHEDMKKGNFQMFSAMWTPVTDPDLLYQVFHSSNIPTPNKAGGNRGGFRDAEIDAWLDASRSTLDMQKRKALYRRIEEKLSLELPYVPLWFEDKIIVMNRRVKNFVPTRSGSLLGLRKAFLDLRPIISLTPEKRILHRSGDETPRSRFARERTRLSSTAGEGNFMPFRLGPSPAAKRRLPLPAYAGRGVMSSERLRRAPE